MELTFLGTGSAYPSPTRGASSITLKHEDWVWMFDCGEGTQIQVMKSNIKASKISKIFISHLHGDHMFGLPGLLCTIGQNNLRADPVQIYGPEGLRRYLRISLELSRSELGFSYVVHELKVLPCQYPEGWTNWTVDHSSGGPCHPNEEEGTLIVPNVDQVWNLLDEDKISVCAVWLKHRVPSFGFCVLEKPLPGKLCRQKCMEKGISPGPLYGKLKAGESVTTGDGKVVMPGDVLGPSRPGRKIVITGDTCDSTELLKVGRTADVLVHEATLEDEKEIMAIEKGHSTPAMAAEIARELGVKTLILTHFSQRYRPLDKDTMTEDDSVWRLVKQAAQVFGEAVDFAEDFKTFIIPLKPPPV